MRERQMRKRLLDPEQHDDARHILRDILPLMAVSPALRFWPFYRQGWPK